MDEIFDFRELQKSIDVNVDVQIGDVSPKYMNPKKNMGVPESMIKFERAIDLARHVILSKHPRYYVLLSGNFIFGDFIEAFIMMKGLKVKELTIATLSLSRENIESLKNLEVNADMQKINLIVSDYFYAHNKKTAIPYIYKCLDENDILDFAVAAIHAKVTLIETQCGKKIVMDGSANLRSSSNVENLRVEWDDALYDFNYEHLQKILQEYSTINKSLRDKKLWQTITAE